MTSKSANQASLSAQCSSHLAQASNHALAYAARSLVEGDTDVSIFTFATGIELAIKARVAQEHWMLLVKVPYKVPQGSASLWEALKRGEAKTVGASEALGLLMHACQGDERSALSAAHPHFSDVASERNRSVHFGIALGAAEMRGYLAALQIRAYRSLKELASHWPHTMFSEEDWEELDESFEDIAPFIEDINELVRPGIKELHQSGKLEVGLCPSCECESLATQPNGSPNPVLARCRVCQATAVAARGECARATCERTVLAPIIDGDRDLSVSCVTCEHSSRERQHGGVTMYGNWNRAPGEVDEDIDPTCAECSWDESRITAFKVDGDLCFYCHGCDSTYRMSCNAVGSCDWCSKWWLGANLEESGITGCGSCGGSFGHSLDKAMRD